MCSKIRFVFNKRLSKLLQQTQHIQRTYHTTRILPGGVGLAWDSNQCTLFRALFEMVNRIESFPPCSEKLQHITALRVFLYAEGNQRPSSKAIIYIYIYTYNLDWSIPSGFCTFRFCNRNAKDSSIPTSTGLSFEGLQSLRNVGDCLPVYTA